MELTKQRLLTEDFDPWYVMLSPPALQPDSADTAPARDEDRSADRVGLTVEHAEVDYAAIARGARREVQNYLREQWKDLRRLTPTEKAAALLSSSKFRNGKAFDVKSYLIDRLSSADSVDDPVQLTLPSFPFKIPNPEKVVHRNADVGELLCLRRLYSICYLIEEILDRRAQYVVVSDGKIYSDICGVYPYEYYRYRSDSERYIAAMGVADNITVVDMIDDVIGPEGYADYCETLAQVESELSAWWATHRDTDKVRYLVDNMASNISLSVLSQRALTQDLEYARRATVEERREDALGIIQSVSEELADQAESSAFLFTAKLVTLRILDSVNLRYGTAIRSTVHPKPGQYGIHLVDRTVRGFPWQTTPVYCAGKGIRLGGHPHALAIATHQICEQSTGNVLGYSDRGLTEFLEEGLYA